ncbi:hypothetical protein [Hymenobacter jeollabukensis]|uniref:Uncharacterized protein n=1 Tax=Hymenobacter jeollabukensis TaxID=2025313 RepID=A0A5R8WPL9_9BACT|nr:hypothetical protein [Hymenobacter jeollabukensis]TLM91682.1 hypothetical protein FDY95_14055 [Hymenobacter jeollabukensis]
MNPLLEHIINLEEDQKYQEAYEFYRVLYSANKLDYDIWKNFYIFLWLALEETPEFFQEKINLQSLLPTMLTEGKQNFSTLADFNFIAGYTVSILPYEFGEFSTMEDEATRMLLKAFELDPSNTIYRMVYLGNNSSKSEEYLKSTAEAGPIVLHKFAGAGMLNKYFRQVLFRLNKE